MSSSITISFLQQFSNTNYNIQASISDSSPQDAQFTVCSWNDKTATSVVISCCWNGTWQSTSPCDWVASGY